jgi:predicted 3-demethylubiquinone-9 3-methyltransferase (glyoxalase superfamily)
MAKPKQAPGKNGFKYREQYGVIVLCKTEREQQAIFNKLKESDRGQACAICCTGGWAG